MDDALGGYDAALVIDAEDYAESGVEDGPACEPDSLEADGYLDGGEEEWDGWEEKSSFLVLEAGERSYACDCGPEEGVLSAAEEQQRYSGTEQLGKIGAEVLPVRVQAVLS